MSDGWNLQVQSSKKSTVPEENIYDTFGKKFRTAFIENGRLKLLGVKTLQVGALLLVGGIGLTLLKYARLTGSIPALLVSLPFLYGIVHVLKPLSKAWGCLVVVLAFGVMFGFLILFIYVAELFGW